ncbi:hypothetical protein DLJ53_19850 [Acuticoccus sediminis]|uniref:Phasin protein n=1 Tax=Acuticoccus sediminis TaxID=2184697 RepID=A0A8B2NNZ4_9HYPH|nr:hypothetical protein [Acuticoccus sediminis]RAH99988.1 hypothetical protein DLJ53_19850 [Acuticoccus sediminis]
MKPTNHIQAPFLPELPVLSVEPIEAATKTACQMTSDITRETARFVSIRLQRYADFELSLARSSGWMEPMECFMEFSRQTMLDYTREMERMPYFFGHMSEGALLDMEIESAGPNAPLE